MLPIYNAKKLSASCADNSNLKLIKRYHKILYFYYTAVQSERKAPTDVFDSRIGVYKVCTGLAVSHLLMLISYKKLFNGSITAKN